MALALDCKCVDASSRLALSAGDGTWPSGWSEIARATSCVSRTPRRRPYGFAVRTWRLPSARSMPSGGSRAQRVVSVDPAAPSTRCPSAQARTGRADLQGFSCSLPTSREADDGGRTRDLRLGKPTLCQLSYVRARTASLSRGLDQRERDPGPLEALAQRRAHGLGGRDLTGRLGQRVLGEAES